MFRSTVMRGEKSGGLDDVKRRPPVVGLWVCIVEVSSRVDGDRELDKSLRVCFRERVPTCLRFQRQFTRG